MEDKENIKEEETYENLSHNYLGYLDHFGQKVEQIYQR